MITSHQTPANLLHKSYGHGSDMSPADTLFDFKKKKKQLRVTSTSYSRPHWPPTQQYLFQNKQLLTKNPHSLHLKQFYIQFQDVIIMVLENISIYYCHAQQQHIITFGGPDM